MLQSFEQLAAAPGAPLKRQPANAQDVLGWLKAAQVKLQDAQVAAVSAGTRMDAAWDAVLLACLAVACAQGWRATSDKGHHEAVLQGATQAVGLGQMRFDELDALRDWRNRKYRAGQFTTIEEVDEAIALVTPFQADVAAWFASRHSNLMKQGAQGKAKR